MLPRLVLRVRRVLKRLPLSRQPDPVLESRIITAQWREMLSHVEARSRASERRLKSAEDALNRLTLF